MIMTLDIVTVTTECEPTCTMVSDITFVKSDYEAWLRTQRK